MTITIEKAIMADAERLTEIMKRTFDEEARRWLKDQDMRDYNIQPPGYSSVEMTKYMIEELHYFKILYHKELVGGIIVTTTGRSFGRIDRIYIDPDYQGRRIGSRVIELIEQEFPAIRTWDLETSSKQVNNHRFYEKMGYETTFETEDEYCYIKRKGNFLTGNQDISNDQYEHRQMAQSEFYQVNLEGSSFSNSNLMNTHISNCNLSHSTFQNLNFTNSLYADLNLSQSKMRFVTLAGVSFLDTKLGEENEPLSFERCNLQGTKIHDCNLQNLAITDSDLTGMTINAIPVEKLLEAYHREVLKK